MWRLNRYIGLSKEGNVSISWPLQAGPDGSFAGDFEVAQWHRKFQGIFLLLAVHAHGEKVFIWASTVLSICLVGAFRVV